MIWQSLGQSSVDSESAAPLTVLLTVSDQRGILVETIGHSLEYSVPDVVGLHLAGRLAVLVEVEPGLAGDLLHTRILLQRHIHVRLRVAEGIDALVGEHHVAQKLALLHEIHSRRELRVDGKFIALEYVGVNLLADSVKGGLISHTCILQFLTEGYDAVFLLPSLDLLLCTVGRLVARRVATVTVGDNIQKRWALLLKQIGLLAVESVDDGERIVTVHPFSIHGIGLESGSKTCWEHITHRLALCLATHSVLVVHHVEENRQSALHVTFPKSVELIHRGECHALKNRSAGHRPVTEVGDNNALLAVNFLVQSGSHGDRAGTAHDGVVRVYSERGEERVHRSAETLVETGRAGEDLGHRSVEQETDSEFLDILPFVSLLGHVQGGSAPELLHDLLQFSLRKDLNRTQSLGEDLTVRTVRAEDEVICVKAVGHTDSGGLLTGRQVGRPRVIVSDTVVATGGLDQIEHGLELTDVRHVAVDAEQILLCEVAFLKFLLDGLVVRHHRNLRKLKLVILRTQGLVRIDV